MLKKIKHLLKSSNVRSKEDIVSILDHALERKLIDQFEYKITKQSLSARTTAVHQTMLAKAETIVLTESMSLDQIFEIYTHNKHSRYPVLDQENQVVGILLIKDLIPLLHHQTDTPIQSILRPAHFVTESEPILSLLNEMQRTHKHMSIVLDEYGQFCGIITIEDLLEQIVGNIEDEHDTDHPEYIQQIDTHKYRINGRTSVEQFNQYFKANLPLEEFDTISGILSQRFGYIPKQGEITTIDSLKFTIHSASPSAIEKITLETSTT